MVACYYARLMVVKVSYPHDPERFNRWIAKHASVVQIVAFSVVGLSCLLAAVLTKWLEHSVFLLVIPGLGVPALFLIAWSYQEGGGDGDNEG